ncbi:MAG TPA: lactate permease LctP family transporter [Vicinamibacterales bacterium]|nr:lactate permease LctP family transporter [Vicinamibacterales bacterium]
MWTQASDPLGNAFLSALAGAIPVFFLFWALAIRRLKGHVAAVWATSIAIAVAIVVFGMPAPLAIASTLQGALYGLFPIGWIVVAAVFLYRVTVESGQFAVIRDSIASLTADRRLQALLIAFSFGAFLEGAAGFGAPVAISAAMLVGLGFEPIYAAGLCLIANTAPVAFGSIGTPILVAAGVTGIDVMLISQMVGRQLPVVSLIVPLWLVVVMSGWKGAREVWPAALVSGGSFALAQWWSSNYLGPMLPDIISSLVSIVCLVAFLRVWRPSTTFRFEKETMPSRPHALPALPALAWAWSPFIVLTILVANWGMRPVKALLDTTTFTFAFPVIHNALVLPGSGTPAPAVFTFNWLSATGTATMLAGIVAVAIARMHPATALAIFGRTLASMAAPLLTIASVLGLAYIGNSSGITRAMGVALASTGALFPLFSPVLGWLGVFMTGSDTSSNAVFGRLQTVSAEHTGMSPILAIASNSSGGVTGKMISPQSIAVACAATGLVGHESSLFRFTLRHSLLLLAIMALITWLQATVLSWMVPG